MQNIELKNQVNLHNQLPRPILGSKFTKLTNRFACKIQQPINSKFQITDPLKMFQKNNHQNIQISIQNINKNQHIEGIEKLKDLNNKLKEENKNLNYDLKKSNEKLLKANQIIFELQQKIKILHSSIERRQNRKSSYVQMTSHFMNVFKDKMINKITDVSSIMQPLEQSIKQFKKYKGQLKRNTLTQIDYQQFQKQKKQTSSDYLSQLGQTQKQRLSLYSKETEPFGFFKSVLENYKGQNQFSDTILEVNKQEFPENSLFNKFSDLFSKVISSQSQINEKFQIYSQTVSQCINPGDHSFKLYQIIKQIFDHSIDELQVQKMIFLQQKNKRLLKNVAQCRNCDQYELTLNEVFKIIRQSFIEMKYKLMPQICHSDEVQFIL